MAKERKAEQAEKCARLRDQELEAAEATDRRNARESARNKGAAPRIAPALVQVVLHEPRTWQKWQNSQEAA